jgi:hypothetical protein
MAPRASTGVSLQQGPLIAAYHAAHANGSLSIGSYEDFFAPGIALVGTAGWVIALVDEDESKGLKVAGKLAPVNFIGPVPEFEAGEHTAIGDSILLKFGPTDPGAMAWQVPLAVQSGLMLTYGQIVALGGDFYGVPDEPIADGGTPAERQQRFRNAYDTLAHGSVTECRNILNIMQREVAAVNDALRQGLPASTAYEQLGNDLNKGWNRATGGGSFFSDLIPAGRYLNLATTNWDHFGEWAVLAYQAGHAVALAAAIEARNAANPGQAKALLTTAYAMNAFADHFLSDLFSAGHMREPRRQIYQGATDGISANLCCKGMHDEDSKFGLRVSNAAGNTWRAYGDKKYFATVNQQNKELVNAAVQASATEIFDAFINGVQPAAAKDYGALRFAPDLVQVQDYRNNPLGNFVPMFVVDGETVKRRNDLNDLNTPGWYEVQAYANTAEAIFGVTKRYHPSDPTDYIAPPAAAPQISPTGWQSTVPIPPNWYNGNRVRYAVSFTSLTFESELGPSCAYVTLNNAFQPTLTGLPTGPAGVTARNIYREFINQPITYCGTVADNTTATFVDTTP